MGLMLMFSIMGHVTQILTGTLMSQLTLVGAYMESPSGMEYMSEFPMVFHFIDHITEIGILLITIPVILIAVIITDTGLGQFITITGVITLYHIGQEGHITTLNATTTTLIGIIITVQDIPIQIDMVGLIIAVIIEPG